MILSVCLATHNEENNLTGCLESAKAIADEIIIVDGSSSDKTVEIAKKYGAHVVVTDNPAMFHINKQKALDLAKGEWILQLDADEQLTPELRKEIIKVIEMDREELTEYQRNLKNRELFMRHQELINKSQIPNPKHLDIRASNLEFSAFYLPRLNYFLGKFLRYGGVYPDGAIRLVKKGKAHFPCKDLHEVMKVEGKVGWLQNDLLHYDSPTFKRYLERNKRYINSLAQQLKDKFQISSAGWRTNFKLFINWVFIKPIFWFLYTQIRHKGILDGWQGIVFSFFSALRFPRAYLQYRFGK